MAAAAQYRLTFRINPGWPRMALAEAWTQATHPDAKVRNGAQALRTAKLTCQATDYELPQGLDVLAAAHAELRQFKEAVSWERKALALLPTDSQPNIVQAIQDRLRLYEHRQPFRQQPQEGPPR